MNPMTMKKLFVQRQATQALAGWLILAWAGFLNSHVEAQAVGRTNVPPTVTATWTASPSPGVTAYRIYYGVASMTFTNAVQVPSTQLSCVISNLVRGVAYYFAATATDGTLESAYSNETSYTLKALPAAPTIQSVTGN